jgi:hypothetical protein
MSRDPTPPPDAKRPVDVPDPDAPPSEEELRAASHLRNVLERGETGAPESPDGELVQSIRAATSPSPLAQEDHRRILDAALSSKPRGKVIYLAFGGLASLAAMAAAVALVINQPAPATSAAFAPARPAMAISRSTAQLFPEGIPVAGGTSERVDRIAYARGQDLRENQFARWGVK